MSEKHPLPEIHAWHDGRVSDEERAALARHVATCASCRSELEALGVLDALLHRLETPEMPPDREPMIRVGLDREQSRRRSRRRTWQLMALTTAAALVVFAVLRVWQAPAPDWPALAAASFAELESGELRLDFDESVPQILEQKLRAQGATVRVLDLAMMGFQVIGGSVREVNRHRIALVVYRNAEGRILLCEMFAGGDIRLPPPLEERRSGGIDFSVYDRVGRTAVFWREGEVLCALVSGGRREEVVALAIAKAKVPGSALKTR